MLIKSVVNKDKNNYYNNIFLEKGSYKDKFDTRYFLMNVCILFCYISIEFTFLKELILIKQVHQKSAILVAIGFS